MAFTGNRPAFPDGGHYIKGNLRQYALVPLEAAVRRGDAAMVSVLLQYGADYEYVGFHSGDPGLLALCLEVSGMGSPIWGMLVKALEAKVVRGLAHRDEYGILTAPYKVPNAAVATFYKGHLPEPLLAIMKQQVVLHPVFADLMPDLWESNHRVWRHPMAHNNQSFWGTYRWV